VKDAKFEPIGQLIWVAEYGQPPHTSGGLYLPDAVDGSGRYMQMDGRFGEVIAVGSGRRLKTGEVVPFEVEVGDVVVFSRRWGLKLHIQHQHPEWGPVWVRALDPNQTVAVMRDFEPWWNPTLAQVHPDTPFSG